MASQAECVEFVHGHGIGMGSVFHGEIIGWTTDEAKADACAEVEGLAVFGGYNRTGPRGWEIVARRDPPPEEDADDA